MVSAPAGVGGAERIVAAIAGAGQPRWEQEVVNLSGANPELAAACAPLEVRAGPASPPLLAGRRVAARALRELRPDIVHAHLPLAMATLASLRRRGERVRLATHHHGDHLVVSGHRAAAAVDRAAGRRCDLVVAPSEAVRRFLIDGYGYREDAVRTIVNGWAGEPLAPGAVPKAEQPTAICVANFRPEKDHELLLRAFARVRERLPEARLTLVGGGPGEGEVRRLTGELGLGSAVELTGHVDSVWPYLARSHLLVLPSHHETLGIAALEAMAAGLPVVATAVGGVPELVRPGVTGELVAPGDVAAMAAAVGGLLASPERAGSMGAAGRVAAAGHTCEATVGRYLDLYAELLSA
jgi:glycosyltransferase involved in cell wall biosynthesis